jgi:hypothetical protein
MTSLPAGIVTATVLSAGVAVASARSGASLRGVAGAVCAGAGRGAIAGAFAGAWAEASADAVLSSFVPEHALIVKTMRSNGIVFQTLMTELSLFFDGCALSGLAFAAAHVRFKDLSSMEPSTPEAVWPTFKDQ